MVQYGSFYKSVLLLLLLLFFSSAFFLRPFPLKFTVFHVYLISFSFLSFIHSFFLSVVYISRLLFLYLFVFSMRYSLCFEFRSSHFSYSYWNNFYCIRVLCSCNIYCKCKSNHCGALTALAQRAEVRADCREIFVGWVTPELEMYPFCWI